MKITLESKIFKSRWGYHPCDYETFLKLKKLNYIYFQALKIKADWERWDRKEPQNRVIRKWKRDVLGRKIGKEIIGPKQEPKINNIFLRKEVEKGYIWDKIKYILKEYDVIKIININIMKEYQKAKHPQNNKENVVQLKLTKKEINEWFKRINLLNL